MNLLATLGRYWAQLGIITPFIYYWREMMQVYFALAVLLERTIDRSTLSYQNNNSSFDFVIVGGGTAGTILAARLSQNHSVLLLEAGGSPSFFNNIPLHIYMLLNLKSIDWSHETTPQKYSGDVFKNNVMLLSAGKFLGGSSSLNGMVYIRGNVQGFDEIAEKTGDPIWKMDNMLKYLKKIENYDGEYKDGPEGVHGKGGYTNIETTTITLPVVKQILKAGVELGYPTKDPNVMGPYTEGFSVIELMEKSGARNSLYYALLWPQRNNPNLTVRKFSYVTRVLLHGTEAYGVEYERHGKTYVVNASKEVILSAGTFMSPKILMLSGIGEKEHLREIGINAVLDLPVGQRLQDKYGSMIGPILVDDGNSFLKTRDVGLVDVVEYFLYGTGMLTTTRADASFALLTNFSRSLGLTSAPDVHAYINTYSVDNRNTYSMETFFNAHKECIDYYNKHLEKDMLTVLLTVAKPYGFGTFKLRDKNPHSPAVIDPQYLKDERDVAALLEGMKFIMKLLETDAMKKINAHLSPEIHPKCKIHTFKSDKYFECLLRYWTGTAYKFCGTVPVGKDTTDPFAVLDPHLRVLGAKRLRVVDASVLNTRYVSVNDPVVRAMTEMISEIILDSWKDKAGPEISIDENNIPTKLPQSTLRPELFDKQTSVIGDSSNKNNKNIFQSETRNVCQRIDHLLYPLHT